MFASILSGRANAHGRLPNRRLVGKVDAALAALPAPWQVLRNRRTSAADGPPWAKYIALHPKKGIALVDILPANPHAAIAPLEDFLQRTGFAAFSRGDPPIVAVAIAERDIPALANRLSEGFAAAPRCGIKNTSWTDAAIELLVTTPGLLLTRMERDTEPKRKAREAATEPEISVAPPPPERSAARIEPQAAQASAARDQPTAEPRDEPLLRSAKLRDEPLPRFLRSEELHDEPPLRSEPNLSRAAQPGALEELDWRSDRLTSFEHRRANRRRGVVALLAVPVAAAAIALIAYPHFAGQPTAPATEPQATAPQPAETSSMAAVTPPSVETRSQSDKVTEAMPVSPPPRDATPALSAAPARPVAPATPTPPVAAAIAPPTPKAEAPAAKRETSPPKLEALAKPEARTPAGAKYPSSEPTPRAASRAQPPAAPDDARKVASRSQPTDQPAPQHRVRVANAKPESLPTIDSDAASPETTLSVPSGDAGPSANALPPPNEETVTIDGTTYIRGREPHALGVLTEPPSASAGNDPPAPAPAPAQQSGYNQGLIQPE